MTMRWTQDELDAFQRRMATQGKVRTHRIQDEKDADTREDGRPRTGPRGRPRGERQAKPKAMIPRERSKLEIELERQIVLAKLPAPLIDQPFLVGTRHRLDFQWPGKIGVEVQGEVHRIKDRFKADLGKRAEALLQGWKVLEVGRYEIYSGQALKWIRKLLGAS